jgi:hypothetical protein
MDKLEKTFANCGCLLHCIAVPLTGGGFQAQVKVIRYEDKALLAERRLLPDEPFQSSAEAIESARAWSVSWVRRNG